MEGQQSGLRPVQPQGGSLSLKQRLGKAILEFSSHMMPATGGALVQVWMPEQLVDGTVVLSAQGLPFAVVGVEAADTLLALFRCVSVRYRFATDVMKPTLMGAIGRVYASMEPEMSNDVQTYAKQVYLRVSEAQRCRVHSTLVVPVYGDGHSHRPVAVFELVQSEKECMFPSVMAWLQQALKTVQLHTCDVSKINWNAPLWLGEATRSGLASAAASVSRALPEASGSSGASGDARGNSGRQQQQQQQQQQVGPSSPGTHGSDSSLHGLHKRPGSLHGSRQLLHVEEAAPEALQQQQRQQGQQAQQQQQNQGHGRLDLGTDATLLSMPHARVDDVCEGTSRSLSGPHLASEPRQPVDCSMEINGQQQHPLSAAAAVAAGGAGPGIKQELGQEQLPAQHGQAASAEDQAALQLAMRLGSGQGGSGTDLQRARELAAWMNQNGIGADALDTLKALLNPSSAAGGQDRPGRTSGSCKPGELGRASLGACGGPDASGGPNASKVVRRSLEVETSSRLTAPMLQAHQLLTALGGKPGTSEAGAGLPRSGPGSTNKDDDSISSDGDGDDSDGDGKGDGKGRTGTGAGKRLRYEDLQSQFGLGLKEAAANLGMCATTLKRACRRHGIKRWPRRQIAKLNKALNEMGYQAPPPEALLQSAIKGNKSKTGGGSQQHKQQHKQQQQQQQVKSQPAQHVVVHRQVQHMPPPMQQQLQQQQQQQQQLQQQQHLQQQQQQFTMVSNGMGMPGLASVPHLQQPQQHVQQVQQQPAHVALAMYQAQLQAQGHDGYNMAPGYGPGPSASGYPAPSSMPPPQFIPSLHANSSHSQVQYAMQAPLQQQQLHHHQQLQHQHQQQQQQGLQGQDNAAEALMLVESAPPSMTGPTAMAVGGAQHAVAATPDASMSMGNLDFLDDQDLLEMWGANVACDLSMSAGDHASSFFSQGQAQQ